MEFIVTISCILDMASTRAKPKTSCTVPARPKVTSGKVTSNSLRHAVTNSCKKTRVTPKDEYLLHTTGPQLGGVLNRCANLTEQMAAIKKDIDRSSVTKARVIQAGRLSDVSTSVGNSISSSPPRLNHTPLVIPTAPDIDDPPHTLHPKGPLIALPSNNGIHAFPITKETFPNAPFNRRLISSTPDPEKATVLSNNSCEPYPTNSGMATKMRSKPKENSRVMSAKSGNQLMSRHRVRANVMEQRQTVGKMNAAEMGLNKSRKNSKIKFNREPLSETKSERLKMLLMKTLESDPQVCFTPRYEEGPAYTRDRILTRKVAEGKLGGSGAQISEGSVSINEDLVSLYSESQRIDELRITTVASERMVTGGTGRGEGMAVRGECIGGNCLVIGEDHLLCFDPQRIDKSKMSAFADERSVTNLSVGTYSICSDKSGDLVQGNDKLSELQELNGRLKTIRLCPLQTDLLPKENIPSLLIKSISDPRNISAPVPCDTHKSVETINTPLSHSCDSILLENVPPYSADCVSSRDGDDVYNGTTKDDHIGCRHSEADNRVISRGEQASLTTTSGLNHLNGYPSSYNKNYGRNSGDEIGRCCSHTPRATLKSLENTCNIHVRNIDDSGGTTPGDSGIAYQDLAIGQRYSGIAYQDLAMGQRDSSIAYQDLAMRQRDSGITDIDICTSHKTQTLKNLARQFQQLAQESGNSKLQQLSTDLQEHVGHKPVQPDIQPAPHVNLLDKMLLMSQLNEEHGACVKLKDTTRDLQIQLDGVKADRHKLLLAITEKESEIAQCKQEQLQMSLRLNNTLDGLKKEVNTLSVLRENSERQNHILAVSLTERDEEITNLHQFLQDVKTNVADIIHNIETCVASTHTDDRALSVYLPSLRKILKGDFFSQGRCTNPMNDSLSVSKQHSDILSVSKQHSDILSISKQHSDITSPLTCTNVARHNSTAPGVTPLAVHTKQLEQKQNWPVKKMYNHSQDRSWKPVCADVPTPWKTVPVENKIVVNIDEVQPLFKELCSSDDDGDVTMTTDTLVDSPVGLQTTKKVQFKDVGSDNDRIDGSGVPGAAIKDESGLSRYSVTDYFNKYPRPNERNQNVLSDFRVVENMANDIGTDWCHPRESFSDSFDTSLGGEHSNIDPAEENYNIAGFTDKSTRLINDNQSDHNSTIVGEAEVFDDKSTNSGLTLSSISTLNSVDEENFQQDLARLDENILRIKKSLIMSKESFKLSTS